LEETKKFFKEIEGKEITFDAKSLGLPFNSKSSFELNENVVTIIPEK